VLDELNTLRIQLIDYLKDYPALLDKLHHQLLKSGVAKVE